MTTVILIRHGQSEANRQRVFAGHTDAPLSEMGRSQAPLTAGAIFERFHIDRIYSSDLSRAYDTALPLSELTGLEIEKDESFREIYAGRWEGMALADIKANFAEDFFVWRNDIGSCRPTGGESTRECGERIYKRIVELARENDGKTVAVATHAALIRSLMARVSGKDFSVMQEIPFVTNASYSVLSVDGESVEILEKSVDDQLGELKIGLAPHA